MKSVTNYQKWTRFAIRHKITPKITNLNSKIGEVYALSGEVEEAETYYDNSLIFQKKKAKNGL